MHRLSKKQTQIRENKIRGKVEKKIRGGTLKKLNIMKKESNEECTETNKTKKKLSGQY